MIAMRLQPDCPLAQTRQPTSPSFPETVSISFELRSSLSTYSWDSIEAMCGDDEDEATKDKKKDKKKGKKK